MPKIEHLDDYNRVDFPDDGYVDMHSYTRYKSVDGGHWQIEPVTDNASGQVHGFVAWFYPNRKINPTQRYPEKPGHAPYDDVFAFISGRTK